MSSDAGLVERGGDPNGVGRTGSSLVVKDATVRYGEVVAVDGVSLTAQAGQTTCILGRNGAGKTSLLRAILGLIPFQSGSVSFAGVDLTNRPAWERAGNGIVGVPEGAGVIPQMTVLDNLYLGQYRRKLPRRRKLSELDAALQHFPELKARLRDSAGNLSGGQRQMLAIARALAASPSVLLMDEPSFGLAPLVVKAVFEALRALVDEGLTVLLSEQNATAAFDLADRAYVVERGRLISWGDASEVRQDPNTTKSLFAEVSQ